MQRAYEDSTNNWIGSHCFGGFFLSEGADAR